MDHGNSYKDATEERHYKVKAFSCK